MSIAEMPVGANAPAEDSQPQTTPTAADVLLLWPESNYRLPGVKHRIRFHNEECVFHDFEGKPISLIRWWTRLAGNRGGDAEQSSYTTGARIAESIRELDIKATPTKYGLEVYRQRVALNTPPPKPPSTPIVKAVLKFRHDRAAAAAKQAAKEAEVAAKQAAIAAAAAEKKRAATQRRLWTEYVGVLTGTSTSAEDVEKLDTLMSTLRRSEEDLHRDMQVVESAREHFTAIATVRRQGMPDFLASGPKNDLAKLARKWPEMFDDAEPPALLGMAPPAEE